MAINDNSPSAALVAELSFSFKDELTATIHNALGVAVEIAVVEITKLVGQVLRDVRDQMHETLRDNKSLKLRLHAAETELCVAKGRLEDQRQAHAINGSDPCSTSSRIQLVHQQLTSLSDGVEHVSKTRGLESSLSANSEHEVVPAANSKHAYSDTGDRDAPEYSSSSFCEIREDGRVCTQDIKPDLSESSQHDPLDQKVTKREARDGTPTHFTQACALIATGPGSPRVLADKPPTPEAALQMPAVEVKLEEAEPSVRAASAVYGLGEEELNSDCLSLAQSRLLEDWRPEPFLPSAGHLLADSALFPTDIPDLDLLSSAPSMPPPFPKTFSSRDRGASSSSSSSSLPNPSPPQLYSAPAASSAPGPAHHLCRVCGEAFSQPEELRRHRTLLHPKNLNRPPRRNAFPPGRSPYHCGVCNRDFNRMEHLKIHQRIHTGERPYACSVCNARFRHSWALTRHFRIHTQEKPYTCGQCGKAFRNCGSLRFHQRSHSVAAM